MLLPLDILYEILKKRKIFCTNLNVGRVATSGKQVVRYPFHPTQTPHSLSESYPSLLLLISATEYLPVRAPPLRVRPRVYRRGSNATAPCHLLSFYLLSLLLQLSHLLSRMQATMDAAFELRSEASCHCPSRGTPPLASSPTDLLSSCPFRALQRAVGFPKCWKSRATTKPCAAPALTRAGPSSGVASRAPPCLGRP